MIGRLNHVAIAVRDIAKAAKVYRDTLGAEVSGQGQRSPTTASPPCSSRCPTPRSNCWSRSARARRSPNSSNAIPTAASTMSATRCPTSAPPAIRLKAQGARVLGDGEPKIGAHGKPVLFLHPKDFCGTLVELEQVSDKIINHARRHRYRDLFPDLVGRAVRRAALGRAQPGRGGRGRARHRSGRAGDPSVCGASCYGRRWSPPWCLVFFMWSTTAA